MVTRDSRSTPKGSLQVIAWMKAKELRAARAGFVQQQIEAGEAVQVFPSTDRESLASIYAIGARDFQSTTELLENVQNDPDVANCYVAPPRHILSRASGALRGTPNKAASPTHWGMEALGLSGTPDCSGVMVAVVDSGVDSDHADLQNAIASVENFTTDPDRDLDGHGTHVCGIIAGRGVPPAGMRGVCNAQLAVFKGLGRQYDATAYYRALGAALDRCRIVNLSLGGEGEDLTESLLIEDALRSGVVVVAAMGNDYESGNATHFPAAIDGVIAVGAGDASQIRAESSNTGAHIRLVAPGVDVWSSIPTYPSEIFGSITDYGICHGTSMAAPFVTGAAALMIAASGMPEDCNAVMRHLKTRFCPGQAGWTEELGDGFLDVNASLADLA